MEIALLIGIFSLGIVAGLFIGSLYRFWSMVFQGTHHADLSNIYNAAHDEMKRRGLL